jgi:cell division protein FtsN
MFSRFGIAGAAVMLAAWIAVPISLHAAEPGAVHGSDVMDGKNKPGQDGWSWAPTPRDQAASKSGSTPGEDKRASSTTTGPAPKDGTHLPPGQDPGTPMPTTPTSSSQAKNGGGG